MFSPIDVSPHSSLDFSLQIHGNFHLTIIKLESPRFDGEEALYAEKRRRCKRGLLVTPLHV